MNHSNLNIPENKPYNTSKRLAQAALIFALLMNPTMQDRENNWLSAQESSKNPKIENMEQPKMINGLHQEQIIKRSIKESCMSIQSLKELPKKINYWTLDAKNLPASFDINPKEINQAVSYITVTLWSRSFTFSPSLGKITGLELTDTELILKTTFKNVKYNRHERLPALLRKLWNTPRGKWEKEWFLRTTVIEL